MFETIALDEPQSSSFSYDQPITRIARAEPIMWLEKKEPCQVKLTHGAHE